MAGLNPDAVSGSVHELAQDLREACASKDFELAYQPQVNLTTRQVTAFEALLRWRHPTRGNVPPAVFIPLAEALGLIGEIGQWVLQQACRDAATWPEPVGVAVNVSATQLQASTLPAIVAGALRAAGLAPNRLELEVTETIVMPGDAATLAVLHAIQDLGVRIAMDDFDVGYSALGYLLKFPFDTIKIDHSLVDGLGHAMDRNGVARAIIRAILGLCNELDIACIAEGVQTREQLDLLMAGHCTSVQGYFFGEPQPAHAVPAIIRAIAEDARPEPIAEDARPEPIAEDARPEPIAAGSSPAIPQPDASTIPFRTLIETANDIIIVTTPDIDPPGPVIVYVNAAFTRLTGYTVAETIGRSPRMLQGPGTDRATLDAIRRALRDGVPVQQKVLNYRKCGAPYWLDLRIMPLRDASGAVAHFAAIERDITMDKRRLDELEYLADRDTLTGIPNRRAVLRAIAAQAESAHYAASGLATKGLCIAMVDIDHFKAVNDEHGHATGDAVLCGVADCLAENIRRLDVIGRIGGEEFLIGMPGVSLPDARERAEQLRKTIQLTPLSSPVGPVMITVSIGVASWVPGENIAALLERADTALYAAKRTGRNRVRVTPGKRLSTPSVS